MVHLWWFASKQYAVSRLLFFLSNLALWSSSQKNETNELQKRRAIVLQDAVMYSSWTTIIVHLRSAKVPQSNKLDVPSRSLKNLKATWTGSQKWTQQCHESLMRLVINGFTSYSYSKKKKRLESCPCWKLSCEEIFFVHIAGGWHALDAVWFTQVLSIYTWFNLSPREVIAGIVSAITPLSSHCPFKETNWCSSLHDSTRCPALQADVHQLLSPKI
jgi:hypothetical protein